MAPPPYRISTGSRTDLMMKATIMLYAGLMAAQPFSCAEARNDCPVFSANRWIPYNEEDPPEHRVILRTTIRRDGSILWHGKTTSERQLNFYLRIARQMNPTPYLVLQYEAGTPCSQIDHFREVFEQQADCGRSAPCSARALPGR